MTFWLGLVLAIPIGIIVNLFTPSLQKLLANRSQRFAAARKEKQLSRVRFAKSLLETQYAYQAFAQDLNSRLVTYLVVILVVVNVPFLPIDATIYFTKYVWVSNSTPAGYRILPKSHCHGGNHPYECPIGFLSQHKEKSAGNNAARP